MAALRVNLGDSADMMSWFLAEFWTDMQSRDAHAHYTVPVRRPLLIPVQELLTSASASFDRVHRRLRLFLQCASFDVFPDHVVQNQVG